MDYSALTPRDFEKLSKEYLQDNFPEYEWSLTPVGNDGNKDIVCKYQCFTRKSEIWAEAKFTASKTASKLQKSQLDPTLLSAMLHHRHVDICFISNNTIPTQYQYRVTDFTLKTQIGVDWILKDKFEQWLICNPDICKRYKITDIPNKNQILTTPKTPHIKNAVIIEPDISRGNYGMVNKLLCDTKYYLYLIIDNIEAVDCRIKIAQPSIILPNSSKSLPNPNDFQLKNHSSAYKFVLQPIDVYNGHLDIQLFTKSDNILCSVFRLADIYIQANAKLPISYSLQEKVIFDFVQITSLPSVQNEVLFLHGQGASGKTHLLSSLHESVSDDTCILFIRFENSELLNRISFAKLLLFLNIGNVLEYDSEILQNYIETVKPVEKRLYFEKLLDAYQEQKIDIIHFLLNQIRQGEYQLIYPRDNRIKNILILEDIHKLSSEEMYLLQAILRCFINMCNNQLVFCSSRKDIPDITTLTYVRPFFLCGLSKEDKERTISIHLEDVGDMDFHRSTDDVIVFSNILWRLSQKKNGMDEVSFKVLARKHFEKPLATNTGVYKEWLAALPTQARLVLELIYYVANGIWYDILAGLYPPEIIDQLLDERFIKQTGGLIKPFHDHYVQAYFESWKLHTNTISILAELPDLDPSNAFYYYTLLIQSSRSTFMQFKDIVRKQRDKYYHRTDLYKAYLLATGICRYIDENEYYQKEDIRDTFVRAITAHYMLPSPQRQKLYEKVIGESKQYFYTDNEIRGLSLRAETEILNLLFWRMDLHGAWQKLKRIRKNLSKRPENEPIDTKCAYLNLLNRYMMLLLLEDRYAEAEVAFVNCVEESKWLKRQEYIGYAYMDYARGLYLHNLPLAFDYMQTAYEILSSLESEKRRMLDCSCELEYIRCLIGNIQNLERLERSSMALREDRLTDLYVKSRIKIAAIKIHWETDSKLTQDFLADIRNEIITTECVQEYSGDARIQFTLNQIKCAYYILAGNNHEAISLNKISAKQTEGLGNLYKQISQHNLCLGAICNGIRIKTKDSNDASYYIDPRLW